MPSPYESIVITNGGTVQSTNTADVTDVSIGGSSTYAVLPGINSYFTPNSIYLGTFGSGTLTVGSQALVAAAGNVYAGYGASGNGVITLNGGTLSPFDFYAGYEGSATINMINGSTLESTTGWVGYAAGSTGVVNLDASTWTVSEQGQPRGLRVGYQGAGTVHATNSQISALTLTLGETNASASGVLTASGGTITIQDATVVGNVGSGTLALSNGATLKTYGLTVGALANSTGSLSVTGSTLTNSIETFIGFNGAGTLTASNAQIYSKALFIARNLGSISSASLSGGAMTLTEDIHVGSGGYGTFTLSGGGILHSDIGNVAYEAGSKGEVNILGGAWNNRRAIFVGVSGNGTINIGDNGTIESESGYLGQVLGGTGTVNITGNSSWTMTNTLVVGVNGEGHLNVSGGGQVGSVWSQIGLNPGAGGTVTLSNGLWETTQTLTIGSGADGSLTAVAGSSLTAGAIELAGSGLVTGSLRATNSTISTGVIAPGGGTATVHVSGVDLKLLGGPSVIDTYLISGFAPGDFVVGIGGLTVDTQGGNAQIASELTGAGALTKTGAGRLRLDTANTFVGGITVNEGVLEITSEASMSTGGVTIGTAELRAITNVTLSAGPSSLTVTNGQTGTFSANAGNTFTVATTNFTLQDGAGLTAGSAGKTGTVVFAPGGVTTSSNVSSVAVQAGTLAAGNARLAVLTAFADATTVAAGATLAFQDNLSTGGINALFGAGTVNTGTNSATSLVVNSGNFAGNIAGWGGLVKQSAGTLTLSGQNAFTGGTTVNAGTLIVDGNLSFGLGNVMVNTGGTLGGGGLVGGITLAGGTISPGNSPGTLNAESLFWGAGTLRFELGPTPATSDHLVLSSQLVGLALPSGPYTFDFVDAGWSTNTTYDLITFDLTDIAIGDFNCSNGGGFDGNFAYNGKTLQFTVTAVPEPGTLSLVACAAVLGWLLRTRRNRRTTRILQECRFPEKALLRAR